MQQSQVFFKKVSLPFLLVEFFSVVFRMFDSGVLALFFPTVSFALRCNISILDTIFTVSVNFLAFLVAPDTSLPKPKLLMERWFVPFNCARGDSGFPPVSLFFLLDIFIFRESTFFCFESCLWAGSKLTVFPFVVFGLCSVSFPSV